MEARRKYNISVEMQAPFCTVVDFITHYLIDLFEFIDFIDFY